MYAFCVKYFKESILGALMVLNGVLCFLLFQYSDHSRYLTVAMLNIGQGDAIYIEAPNGNQIIFDGGPDSSIIPELAKVMPFGDRSIDALVVTNPDKDHYAGFFDVLRQYDVGEMFEPGTHGKGVLYESLKKRAETKRIPITELAAGEKIILDDTPGKEVVIDILFPDRDVSRWTTNDGSLVARLSYGSTSVMLTGDTTARVEGYLVQAHASTTLQSTILKVAHHGSRTASSLGFVEVVHPEHAIISAGYKNTYGHPHKETLETFRVLGIPVSTTIASGTIRLYSDGQRFLYK